MRNGRRIWHMMEDYKGSDGSEYVGHSYHSSKAKVLVAANKESKYPIVELYRVTVQIARPYSFVSNGVTFTREIISIQSEMVY